VETPGLNAVWYFPVWSNLLESSVILLHFSRILARWLVTIIGRVSSIVASLELEFLQQDQLSLLNVLFFLVCVQRSQKKFPLMSLFLRKAASNLSGLVHLLKITLDDSLFNVTLVKQFCLY